MRFKPPPPNSKIGWRVEFRPCELQITDFENAAICCFIVLLTRVLISYKYNLLIPISKVDDNMATAQKRDAILNGKFHFRTNINTVDGSTNSPNRTGEGGSQAECSNVLLCAKPIVREMTIDEIFNGSKDFPGLLNLIKEYLNNLEIDTETSCTLTRYLTYLKEKAAGNLRTNARYMRDFVQAHPDYQQDSKVSEKVQYELLMALDNLRKNEKKLNAHLKRN